jgi:hypothetical protein
VFIGFATAFSFAFVRAFAAARTFATITTIASAVAFTGVFLHFLICAAGILRPAFGQERGCRKRGAHDTRNGRRQQQI